MGEIVQAFHYLGEFETVGGADVARDAHGGYARLPPACGVVTHPLLGNLEFGRELGGGYERFSWE